MNAEILCVGTEILLGNIVNTNAQYIAQKLAEIGIDTYYQSVVGDNHDRMRKVLSLALERSDILVITGGLGPTYDDMTKESVAEYFGKKLVLDSRALEELKAYFSSVEKPMTDNNVKQAYVPQGATVLYNQNGTAPGIIVEDKGKIVAMMPGVPREMKLMMDTQVVPYLQKLSGKIFVSRNIHIFGLGESAVENELKEMMVSSTNPTIAPYAKTGEVMLRVTASAHTQQEAEAMIVPVLSQIEEKIGRYIYGIDVGDLQTAAVKQLAAKGLKVAVAESCTGGWIAKRLTDVPGASSVFDCGICSYANEIKSRILGVKEETLKTKGAVSEETAMQMAEGVRKLAGADIGLSTTGIAGPDGGTVEKPVGLVYIGISTKKGTRAEKFLLQRGKSADRENIRWLASSKAFGMLLNEIKGWK